MATQINIILLSLGAIQGALLSWYLLRNQKAHVANIYFLLILMGAGLQLTLKVMSKVWLMKNFYLPYLISYELPYLMGPLIYLYIRSRASGTFKKTDVLHFIPFITSVFLLAGQFYGRGNFLSFGLSPYGRALLQMVSLGTYAILAWKIIQKQVTLRALKSFLTGFAFAEMIIIVTLALMYVYYGRFPDVRLLFVVLTFFIYWISYKQMSQPGLFVLNGESPSSHLQVQKHTKYNHSGLKEDEALRISTLLSDAMNRQKIYLHTDLTIDSLSSQLNVSRHHISQVLNERFQKTYADYVNDLRLAEVKSRLQNARYNHFTIAAIAMDCGFNTVSNFNDLFKKKFGITPSQFRAQIFGKMTA